MRSEVSNILMDAGLNEKNRKDKAAVALSSRHNGVAPEPLTVLRPPWPACSLRNDRDQPIGTHNQSTTVGKGAHGVQFQRRFFS